MVDPSLAYVLFGLGNIAGRYTLCCHFPMLFQLTPFGAQLFDALYLLLVEHHSVAACVLMAAKLDMSCRRSMDLEVLE